jgi:hypothetical protein
MIHIPPDWALATTHIASEYVSRQFLALIFGWPNAIPPLELDFEMLKACSTLAGTLADAYRNPGMTIFWRLADANINTS